MRPAMIPPGAAWTSRLPTRKRASATVATGSERLARCVMRGSLAVSGPPHGAEDGERLETVRLLDVVALFGSRPAGRRPGAARGGSRPARVAVSDRSELGAPVPDLFGKGAAQAR